MMDPESVRSVDRAVHGGNESGDVLDFSVNTNPRCPPGVEEIYRAAIDRARAYPPEPPAAFHRAAAEYVGCDASAVIATPGGMAAIRLAIGVTIHTGDPVAVPAPSFAEYEREVRLQGGKPTFIAEDSILTIDPGEYSLVILCQPNNPTGRLYDTHAIREFAAECRETDTVLLVDEAFLDFTTQPSIAGTDGVIVARSLTKMFGLPGVRIGFAVGTGRLRDALYSARLPWNLGAPGIAVGTHCLRQSEFVTETRNRVRSERARMHDRLGPRFEITESHGPFLLLTVRHRDVRSLIDEVRNRGIAIRDATTFRGLDRHVRVAVRVPVENDQLLEALGDV